MLLYIKIENEQPVGYPLTVQTIRDLYPHISFPSIIDSSELLTLGYAEFIRTLPPTAGVLQKAVELTPIFDGTVATQTWELQDMSDQEKADVTANALIAARSVQKSLLAVSDWTEMPSVQAKKDQAWKDAWAEYRTAVRDADKQATWPIGPIWPVEPINDIGEPEPN
jgi:hypothetical protein